jgi:hypothetical protein
VNKKIFTSFASISTNNIKPKEIYMKRGNIYIAIFSLMLVSIITEGICFAKGGRRYEVMITNITRGQVIPGLVVVSHMKSFNLFTLGEPASSQLATIAEEGDSAPLQAHLYTLPNILEYATSGALFPGESVILEIMTRGRFRNISAVGMLASTNDAFFAVNNVHAPKHGVRNIMALAYDAGSEANTELCEFIPGPPCGNHEHDPAEAEGFVHVHAGIHGIQDPDDGLDPAIHDWRNPVVKVSIRPIH